MNTSWTRLLAIVSLSCAALGAAACSDATDPVVNKIDCSSVCNRYEECFDSDYDVDACKDRCENYAEDSDTRQDKLDACDDCLEDSSCTESFKCVDECAGILP